MLTKKEIGCISHIIERCERIIVKKEDLTYELFLKNKDLQEIISFNLLQIGELSKKLSNEITSVSPNIPWNKISGMRDVIAHGYNSIDLDVIYDTVMNDINELHQACKEIIKKND